jgi:glycosyltransferase involved in cell wall biosynthesis
MSGTLRAGSATAGPESPRSSVHQRPITSSAPRVSVVIPTFNEAKNVPHVFETLPEDIFEIVVVDGLSTDGTVEIVRGLYPDVRIVHQTSPGKGNALARGIAHARGDIIVTLDSDGSADPAEIPAFVAALVRGADYAKGSRFLSGGGSNDITPSRRVGNWMLSRLVNLLFGTRYSDLCYGFNAFWKRSLETINVDCDGFEVEAFINIRIKQANLNVIEVPSFEWARIHGRSNLGILRDGKRVLRTILRERLRAESPSGQEPNDSPTQPVESPRDELESV